MINNKHFTFSTYLQLLEVFTIREIKSRYKGSLLGAFWIVLYPLLNAVILSLVFGNFIKIQTGEIPYFLFVLSGLIVWNFFQQGLELAKDSLIWNRDLVTKTAFPKETLPLSYILSKIPDFLVYSILFFIFYLMNGFQINVYFFLFICSIFPLFFFSAGLALIASLAHSIFRDFGRIIDLSLMMLFYATPIIYPDSLVPEKYRIFIELNPLSPIVMFVREVVFKKVFNYDLYILSLILSLITFFIGLTMFKIYGKKITDLI